VELALSRLMVLNREQIDDKLAFNGLVMNFVPSADVVYRRAILLALKGEQEAARISGILRRQIVRQTVPG